MDEGERQIAQVLRQPLDAFVHARAAAVRELREQGLRDAAAELAKLRKPSVVVWTLNQASTVAPDDLDALRAAGAHLGDAQRAVLQGNRAAANDLSRAVQDQRRAVDVLTRRLQMALTAAGGAASESTLRQVSESLRAASIADEDTWTALREGRLLHEPAPTGFGETDVSGMRLALAPDQPDPDDRERRRLSERAEAAVHRAEELEASAREQADAARARHEEAARALDEARAALRALQGHGRG